jgi:hypothetical protein
MFQSNIPVGWFVELFVRIWHCFLCVCAGVLLRIIAASRRICLLKLLLECDGGWGVCFRSCSNTEKRQGSITSLVSLVAHTGYDAACLRSFAGVRSALNFSGFVR